MQIRNRSVKILSALAVIAFLAAFAVSASPTPAPEKTPVNVAGTWEIHVSGEIGTSTQTLDIVQQGDGLSGTYKGPYQTGQIEGTVDGNAIKFRLTGKYPMLFKGDVTGDTMSGTLTSKEGRGGIWSGRRSKRA